MESRVIYRWGYFKISANDESSKEEYEENEFFSRTSTHISFAVLMILLEHHILWQWAVNDDLISHHLPWDKKGTLKMMKMHEADNTLKRRRRRAVVCYYSAQSI